MARVKTSRSQSFESISGSPNFPHQKKLQMKSLKIKLLFFYEDSPLLFRACLILTGLLTGLFHTWMGTDTPLVVSSIWLVILLVSSSFLYTFVFTVYRMLQRIFNRSGLSAETKSIDERSLVRTAGMFWFVPYGAMSYALSIFITNASSSYGKIVIVQGLAISVGVWLSQRIKK